VYQWLVPKLLFFYSILFLTQKLVKNYDIHTDLTMDNEEYTMIFPE
jgi:hypothetical protein